MFYEPADAALPTETTWSTDAYLAHVPSAFARVREEFGPTLRLLHDVHHRLTPIEAARLGRSLEPYALTWMEDPVPADLQEGFRLIRQHTTTPIAVGEVFSSIWDAAQLIREQLIDYVRTTVVHAGGITHLRRIFDLAALHHVRSGSHGATDLSPVCMAAALHLDLAIPNFGLQEYMRHTEATDEVFPARLPLRGRLPASGRDSGARCGHRRAGRGPLPVRAGLPACEPADGRHRAPLVSAPVQWMRRPCASGTPDLRKK